MRAKINQEGNKLDITIKGNTFTKYINKCILCGKESVDDLNKGDKHICDKCYDLFETNKVRGTNKIEEYETKPKRAKNVSMGFIDASRRISVKGNPIMSTIKTYKPSIKIINLVDYQNLMDEHNVRLNEKIMTTIADLVIKGVNTANKIAKHLGITNIKTVNSLRTYMARMERFGMIVHSKRVLREKPSDNIFTIGRGVVYTQC